MSVQRVLWLYKACPHCGRSHDTKAGWVLPAGLLQKKWWAWCQCSACGSRWGAWPWLEARFGITWRRVFLLNPSTSLTADQVGEFVRLRRQYTTRGELDR